MDPFVDSFDHSIDDKGRVVLPSVYREAFRLGAVVSSKGHYLGVYTPDTWAEFVDRLEAKCDQGLVPRGSVNVVYRNTSNAKTDSQGRILLGAVIRDQAGLGANVRITGHGNHLGIYARTDDGSIAADEPSIHDVVADLSAIGL